MPDKQRALNVYLRRHENLQCETVNWTGIIYGVDTNNSQMEEESFDDIDVPSSAVIHDMLSVEVHKLNQSADHLVLQPWKDLTYNGPVAAMDDLEENIWAWNNGEK